MGNKQSVLRRLPVVGLVSLLLGVSIGIGVAQYFSLERQPTVKQGEDYPLLARRIQIEEPSDITLDFRVLQTQIEQYIIEYGLNDKISFNFEYLPTGSSIGIDENTPQVGASLLKLPLAIATYRQAEEGKIDLDRYYPIKEEWLNTQYGTLYKKGAGYQITPRQAVQYALTDSDNTAALMLFELVSEAQGVKSPNLLGFIDANYSETDSREVLIDSRSYSAVLKCLYFACHLNKQNSQEILEYLTASKSTDRLGSLLPDGLTIAHKIGTFGKDTQSDCGIFYVSQRNYLLCIMIDGQDPEASQRIAELSKLVYNFISDSSFNR